MVKSLRCAHVLWTEVSVVGMDLGCLHKLVFHLTFNQLHVAIYDICIAYSHLAWGSHMFTLVAIVCVCVCMCVCVCARCPCYTYKYVNKGREEYIPKEVPTSPEHHFLTINNYFTR